MTAELNLIQYFKEITHTLQNLEKSVNIFDFAFEKEISTEQAQFVLNSFILQSQDTSNYIIIFRAEISEFDEKNINEKVSIKFFPSYLEDMVSLVAQGKDKILDFGIYCIFKKIEDFVLNDYKVFAHEARKVEILNLNEFEIVTSNPNVKGNLRGLDSKNASKNIGGKASTGSNFEKSFQDKVIITNTGENLNNLLFILIFYK
jgi:hypothetical protein